jgi:hypothetical protein
MKSWFNWPMQWDYSDLQRGEGVVSFCAFNVARGVVAELPA